MVSLSDGVFVWCTAEDTVVMNLAAETSERLLPHASSVISAPTLTSWLTDDLDNLAPCEHAGLQCVWSCTMYRLSMIASVLTNQGNTRHWYVCLT